MLPIRLKELRNEKEYTQEEVATFLGITRPAYTAYEAGKRQPDYEILIKLANYFNVSTDYLLGRSDYRTQPTVQAAHSLNGAEGITEDVLDEIEAILKRAREDMKKGKG
jgi:transcriptional regulator with XRE-family HTH domain